VLRILYIGRLHQIKGIENLLLAMPKIKTRYSLTICGSGDESYRRSLQRLVDDMGLDQRVNFQGQVAGDEKEVAFSHADVCVVPSFTENYGMVVAEALAHGVPVIASRGTPWKSLEQRGCGLWVENTPDSLAQAIEKISEQGLEGMGRIGREWVRKDLDWESVSKKMFSLYKESQSSL
jgi:glycosyltransferase involved in cell wall biosynthesis